MGRTGLPGSRCLLLALPLALLGAGQPSAQAQEQAKEPTQAKEPGGLPASLSGMARGGLEPPEPGGGRFTAFCNCRYANAPKVTLARFELAIFWLRTRRHNQARPQGKTGHPRIELG